MSTKSRVWRLFLVGIVIFTTEARRRTGKNRKSDCPRGCARCDDVNGCTQCRRSFLFISKSRGKEIGRCLHRCPEGYSSERGRPTNRCRKCQDENCKSCFTKAYCTSCRENFFLHADRCTASCPEGLSANPDAGKCERIVDCVVGQWSSWSRCASRDGSRPCTRGRKKRTRRILQKPTENGKRCPRLREKKKCKMPKSGCFVMNKWMRRQKASERRRRKTKKRGKKNHGTRTNSAARPAGPER